MSKNNTGDRKIKRKIDDLETQLSSPLSPIGKEAVIAAEKLARKHPTDSGAVLDALILAATHTPSCQSDEKEVLKSSTSSSHPTRVVQAFIIEYLVKLELKNVDASSSLSPPFKASDIISRFRKVISNIGLKDDDEKIEDDAPWWLIIYIYAIGSMENGVDEVNEILVRNPYPSLCKAVVNEVIAINEVVDARLRPSVVICLDKVPIDTLEGLLTMGHYKGTLPEWLRRDIINRAIKVPLTLSGHQVFHTMMSLMMLNNNIDSSLEADVAMLVAERLLRLVSKDKMQLIHIRELARILKKAVREGSFESEVHACTLQVVIAITLWELGDDIDRSTCEILIESCPLIYSNDPSKDLLISSVMSIQDDHLMSSLLEKFRQNNRQSCSKTPPCAVGCLPITMMWMRWLLASPHSYTNENLPPLAVATLLYRIGTSDGGGGMVPSLVSSEGFSLRMLPQLIQVIPALNDNTKKETAFALANHFKIHKQIAKHESVRPFVYRTMTSLFPLTEAASAIGMHLLRIIPDNYIDKLLTRLQEEEVDEGAGRKESSYLRLLEDYTKEYPARVASMHLDRVQSLITEEASDNSRATGIRLIHMLCNEECMDILKSWQIFKRKQKYLFDRRKAGEETTREVLFLAADVEPGLSGIEYIWSNVSYVEADSFNPQAWMALAKVLRSRGKSLLDDALDHGGMMADLTPKRIIELTNAQLDSESTSEESLRAISACLAALGDIDISNIGRSAYIASNVANQTTSKEISPMGRRLNGYLKSALRRSPLAQLALAKGPRRATLPVLKRLLKTVRVPSGIFGGPYMLATSWKKFINRLLKSGEAKADEVYETLMEGLDNTPANALLGLSALGRCRPLQFSIKAKEAIEKVLKSKVDIGGQAGVQSLAVIAMALLLKSMPYTQALAVAQVLFYPTTEASPSTPLLGPILWMLPYWTLIDHTQTDHVVNRLILGCQTPSTALSSGYGLALLVTLHWNNPEVLHLINKKLTESTPVAADVCARVLVCDDFDHSQAFSGELGAIGAGLAGTELANSTSVEPQLRVLYLGSLYGCPGTLPIIPMDKLRAPRNCDNPMAIVDKLEKYDDECTVGVAVQLMHTAESITMASANHKRREVNNLSYIKEGTALQFIMEGCSQTSETSPRHEIGLLAASQLSEALPRKAMRIILEGAESLSSSSKLKIRILSYCGEVGLSDLFTLYERSSSLPKNNVECLLHSIPLLPQNVFDFEGPLIAALVAVAKSASTAADTSHLFVTELDAVFHKWKNSPDGDGALLCREIVESLIDKTPQLFTQPRLWHRCQAILEENVNEVSLTQSEKLNPLLVARIRRFQPTVRQEILQDTILDKERFGPEQLLKIADDFVQSADDIDESRRTILGLAERFRSKNDDFVARGICRDLAAAISISITGRREMRLAATSFDVTEMIDDILPVELAHHWRTPYFGVVKDLQQLIDYVGKCLTCGYVFNENDEPNVYKLVQNMFTDCPVS